MVVETKTSFPTVFQVRRIRADLRLASRLPSELQLRIIRRMRKLQAFIDFAKQNRSDAVEFCESFDLESRLKAFAEIDFLLLGLN